MGNIIHTIDNTPTINKTKPFLIIKSGPTGSGKSKIENWLCENFKIICEEENNCVISIDEIVEQNTYYKNKINDILEQNNITKYSSDDDINKFIVNPDVKSEFCKAYFTTRNNNIKMCVKDDDTVLDGMYHDVKEDKVEKNNYDLNMYLSESIINKYKNMSLEKWVNKFLIDRGYFES